MTTPTARDLEKSRILIEEFSKQSLKWAETPVSERSLDNAPDIVSYVAEARAAERASLPESVEKALEVAAYHHQGAKSPVGVPVRKALEDLKRWQHGE